MNVKPTDSQPTPKWIFSMFDGWFDPCPLDLNPSQDGLIIDWHDRTYVNPPYSDPLPWVLKAIEENQKGKTVALLLKLDTSTRWYRELVSNGAHFMHIMERVRFNGNTPPFCNFIAVLEAKP